MEPGVIVISLILRIVGAIVCSNRAKEINRSSSWGLWGFISPIIAMIWIYCLKPKTVWDKDTDMKNQ